MIAALLILLITALLCAALAADLGWNRLARTVAPCGAAGALVVSLWQERLGAVGHTSIAWPIGLRWLGQSPYATDAFSAGMGSWCLLLGLLLLYKLGNGERAPLQLAVGILTIADLYSMVHLDNLLTFVGHMLALPLLTWLYSSLSGSSDEPGLQRHSLSLSAGALLCGAAVLLIGRTTGGDYSLSTLSPGALTVWPVVLLGMGILLWLGCIPTTAWSARGLSERVGQGAYRVVVQTLVIGLPILALLLRIEAALTNQALAGTVPPEWIGLAGAMQWLGGLTALAAGAGCLVWAGLPRWSAMLTAYTMGLMLWALSLDSPGSRLAAIAILVAYGAGSAGAELLAGSNSPARAFAYALCIFSRLQAPLTAGFIGVWLLAGAIGETRHPALALVALGSTILAACGAVMHESIGEARDIEQRDRISGWLGTAIAALLLLGGIMPSLWLPQAGMIAGIAGGAVPATATWQGLAFAEPGTSLPLAWMALGALLLAGVFLLLRSGTRGEQTGILLPTVLGIEASSPGRLSRNGESMPIAGLLANPPSPIWWLSLAWLEAGLWGTGTIIVRLVGRAGELLRRGESRMPFRFGYWPLVVIMVIIVMLLGTR